MPLISLEPSLPPEATPILHLEKVEITHFNTGKNIVENINLTIHQGETVCMVGASGSGKSILAYSIMGLLPSPPLILSKGSIQLKGEELTTASCHRLQALRALQMAMIFQEPMTALNPVRSVGWQIDEVLRLHRSLSRAQRRREILAMLDCVHLKETDRIYDAYPHQVSGGQRQRIMIAMALILKPSLFIADEATTALDVTTQQHILHLIREQQRNHKMGILFITHDIGIAADIADRIVVMHQGKIVEAGSRTEVLHHANHPITRHLLGSVPSLTPISRPACSVKPLLNVQGLTFTYCPSRFFSFKKQKTTAVLSNINLSLRKGEILGLVGESGAGKSTLTRCIVGLSSAYRGQIYFHDANVAQLSDQAWRALRQRVQIVFQDPYRSLNPTRSIAQALIEGLMNFGTPYAASIKQAKELILLMELDLSVLSAYPSQLSGGERQRICLARALLMQPELLIADEIVSALDVSIQAQILKLLAQRCAATQTSVLLITHDLRVAAQMCHTIAVIQAGKIVEYGLASKVLMHPSHPYTSQLIDHSPGQKWKQENPALSYEQTF